MPLISDTNCNNSQLQLRGAAECASSSGLGETTRTETTTIFTSAIFSAIRTGRMSRMARMAITVRRANRVSAAGKNRIPQLRRLAEQSIRCHPQRCRHRIRTYRRGAFCRRHLRPARRQQSAHHQQSCGRRRRSGCGEPGRCLRLHVRLGPVHRSRHDADPDRRRQGHQRRGSRGRSRASRRHHHSDHPRRHRSHDRPGHIQSSHGGQFQYRLARRLDGLWVQRRDRRQPAHRRRPHADVAGQQSADRQRHGRGRRRPRRRKSGAHRAANAVRARTQLLRSTNCTSSIRNGAATSSTITPAPS